MNKFFLPFLAAAVVIPTHIPKQVRGHDVIVAKQQQYQEKVVAHRKNVLVKIIEKRSKKIGRYLEKKNTSAEAKALLAQANAKIAALKANPSENFKENVHEIYQLFSTIAKAVK